MMMSDQVEYWIPPIEMRTRDPLSNPYIIPEDDPDAVGGSDHHPDVPCLLLLLLDASVPCCCSSVLCKMGRRWSWAESSGGPPNQDREREWEEIPKEKDAIVLMIRKMLEERDEPEYKWCQVMNRIFFLPLSKEKMILWDLEMMSSVGEEDEW